MGCGLVMLIMILRQPGASGYKKPMNLYQAGLLMGNVSLEKRVGNVFRMPGRHCLIFFEQRLGISEECAIIIKKVKESQSQQSIQQVITYSFPFAFSSMRYTV
ncbi:hypothetical protein PDUR_24625 [Paenibacillus durus]|uniref:Uncharacterized protein n=1 Tax=Paenibacillus durus TaxID=44251 RepID=A0A089HVB0_PAEDU|nr:hypothetical protein PDUR_24625 [Paenibacillus durus]